MSGFVDLIRMNDRSRIPDLSCDHWFLYKLNTDFPPMFCACVYVCLCVCLWSRLYSGAFNETEYKLSARFLHKIWNKTIITHGVYWYFFFFFLLYFGNCLLYFVDISCIHSSVLVQRRHHERIASFMDARTHSFSVLSKDFDARSP